MGVKVKVTNQWGFPLYQELLSSTDFHLQPIPSSRQPKEINTMLVTILNIGNLDHKKIAQDYMEKYVAKPGFKPRYSGVGN